MLRASHLVSITLLASAIAAACSNDQPKKRDTTDASSSDGSFEGGGSGGVAGASGSSGSAGAAGSDASAGASGSGGSGGAAGSAGAEAGVDAMPDAEAGLDATPEADAALVCASGTVKDLVSNTCLACPLDGGTDAGDAGGDPYQATIACAQVAGATTVYDPATGLLTIHIDYPLEVTSVQYDAVIFYDAEAGSGSIEPTGTLPVTDNTVVLDLSAANALGATVWEVDVHSLVFTDACGRTSTMTLDCQDPNAALPIFTPGDGGAWMAQCSGAC